MPSKLKINLVKILLFTTQNFKLLDGLTNCAVLIPIAEVEIKPYICSFLIKLHVKREKNQVVFIIYIYIKKFCLNVNFDKSPIFVASALTSNTSLSRSSFSSFLP